MKILNKGLFFELLPKLNILLIFSAVFLTIQLYSSINRTYDLTDLQSKGKIARPFELMAKSAVSEKTPLFQDEIFKKKPLFTLGLTKKADADKKVFALLGVSLGKKNIAVIRDKTANKDYYGSEGDMVGDYQIREILKERVVLESNEGTLEITQ